MGSSPAIIRVYRNGTLLLTGVDSISPITSGTVGIDVFTAAAGTLGQAEIDDFSGGDFSTAANCNRRLMEDGTSFRLLETGTDKRGLEGFDIAQCGGATPVRMLTLMVVGS